VSAREELAELGFKVPDSIEPVVAYRSWAHWDSGKGLRSHNGTYWWPGSPMKANCPGYMYSQKRHNGPIDWCTCGIYAATRENASHIVPGSDVYGEVYLWGRILEGPRGYRAEFAYPKLFIVRDKRLIKPVKKLGFGVPVVGMTEEHPFRHANLPRFRVAPSAVVSVQWTSADVSTIVGTTQTLTFPPNPPSSDWYSSTSTPSIGGGGG
jgi:hypothetical protein